MINLCKYCRKELTIKEVNQHYCSVWCREQNRFFKKKKIKIKNEKIIPEKKEKVIPEIEYISCGKCLQCGDDCTIRKGARTKKICSLECQKKYYVKNPKRQK